MVHRMKTLLYLPSLGTKHCPKPAAELPVMEADMQNSEGCWFQRQECIQLLMLQMLFGSLLEE